MLVETHTRQQCEHAHIPLILHKGTCNAHILSHIAVIARHYIVQAILLELHSTRKGSRGEYAVVHAAGICCTGNPGKVIGLAVCIGVALRAIVAVAVNMLHRGKERELMLVGHPADIICDTTAVYHVLGLLGNITLMRLKIELVTATAQFVGRMILKTQTAGICRAVKCAHTEGIDIHLAKFGETVTVMVIRVTVAIVLIERYAVGIIGRHQGGIGAYALLPSLTAISSKVTCHREGVAHRVLCYYVHRTANGIGAEERRTATTHNLHALNHVHRDLFQTIYTAQCTHHRTAVYEHLRVRAFKTIDAHLREATVLAVILDTQARYIVEALGKVKGVDGLEKFHRSHRYHHWGILTAYHITVGRHNKVLHHHILGLQLEVDDSSEFLAHHNLLCDSHIAYRRHPEMVLSCSKVPYLELSVLVAHRTATGLFYIY